MTAHGTKESAADVPSRTRLLTGGELYSAWAPQHLKRDFEVPRIEARVDAD